jgi:hypothetical protein
MMQKTFKTFSGKNMHKTSKTTAVSELEKAIEAAKTINNSI